MLARRLRCRCLDGCARGRRRRRSGLGDRRITPEALPLLGVSQHAERIVRTAWQLGAHPDYAGLRRWVHMLGFRGHFASKSRRYSTTAP